MNQYIYILRPTRSDMLETGLTDEERKLSIEHGNYLSQLVSSEVVLMYGRVQDNHPDAFGIVLLQAENAAAARHIMNEDPGVKYGLMRAQIYPFRVAELLDIQAWSNSASHSEDVDLT